jgi:PBP1b-binding outer membrane lipoprotein LpoB
MVAIITSVIKEKGGTMSKIYLFSVIVTVILFLSGCGYKAPPYYEKPASDKGSSVAL